MPSSLPVRILRRLIRPLLETGSVTFFVRDLLEPESAPVPREISVRQLHATDKDAVLHGADPLRGWHVLKERFAAGELCFAALDEHGRALLTRWVTLTRAYIPELDRDFVPGADAVYAYDAYTRPEHRRRGYDAAVRLA